MIGFICYVGSDHLFGIDHAIECRLTRALRNADMAITEVRCDNPPSEMSGSIQKEDAFFIAWQLRDVPNREYWEDGRLASVCDLLAGEILLSDLKREPGSLLDTPFHTLAIYLPRAALDTIADDADAPRITRAFHGSVGMAPHRWLMKCRIEVAKEKPRDERGSLTMWPRPAASPTKVILREFSHGR